VAFAISLKSSHSTWVFSPQIAQMAIFFPRSLYLSDKYFSDHLSCPINYVVCQSCHALYLYESCIEKGRGVNLSKKCSHCQSPVTLLVDVITRIVYK